MNEEKQYFKRLDFIRIISCIMVLFYHLKIIQGGFLAVCTFFTLNGYLNYISAVKSKKFSIKSYYINKIKKIYLPLIIVISVTLILSKQIMQINWLNLKQETISVIFGYNNFWQLSVNLDYFTKNIHSPFIHLWYISILMQFDLIFPFIFVILKKVDRKINNNMSTWIVFSLTIISTVIFCYVSKTQPIKVVYYNTFARSFSIIFGVFLALLHHKYGFKIAKLFENSNKAIFILYSAILVALCIFVPDRSNNYAIYMILTTFISIRLIEYSIIEESKRKKTDKFINFLAKITYEIYLVQYPIIFFMQNIKMNDGIKAVFIICLTFVISYIVHLLINKSSKSKINNGIKIILIIITIIFGTYTVITEKSHTAEMNELENRLKENLKIMEEKNKNYINKVEVNQIEDKNKKYTSDVKVNSVKETIRKLPIVGVGDSVFLDVVDELYKRFPNGYFDGKISRSIIEGKEVLANLKKQGKLGNTVILALSTNGDYSDRLNKELMKLLGNREIYWINAVGADDPNFNDRFKKFATNYPNIHIVDWESAAKNHSEYFYADGIHAKENGLKVYVNVLYETIYNNYLEKSRK